MTDPTIKYHNRQVAIWLFVCCALVFAIVVLGGVTRLTGSGLSMVDWRPVTGLLPPLGEAAWGEMFSAYQGSPEFQKINHAMSLAEFKSIFWFEYCHRLLGRTIGIVFLIPFLVFVWRGAIRAQDWVKYSLMFVLGGLQGVLGWYMVKSGLIDNPHVSQYRLTAHLLAAFAIYAYMLWVALSLLYRATDGRRHSWYPVTLLLTSIVSLTIVSGGFVAGLKAGLAYNTFPLMTGQWVPDGMYTVTPVWRNIFDNVLTVQFNHRLIALTTFFAVVGYWFFARRAADFPRRARQATHAIFCVGIIQVALGIATLLCHVPVALAATHQANALVLFTCTIYLSHALRGRAS